MIVTNCNESEVVLYIAMYGKTDAKGWAEGDMPWMSLTLTLIAFSGRLIKKDCPIYTHFSQYDAAHCNGPSRY